MNLPSEESPIAIYWRSLSGISHFEDGRGLLPIIPYFIFLYILFYFFIIFKNIFVFYCFLRNLLFDLTESYCKKQENCPIPQCFFGMLL